MRLFVTTITMLCLAMLVTTGSFAQEVDLFKTAKQEAAKEDSNKTTTTIATFKSTRLINGHTIETLGKGMMDFRVHHRFGYLNEGLYDFYGLDEATTLIGFDFGLTNRLMVGISRSTYEKQMEEYAKFRLLRQSTGKVNVPVSVTLLGAVITKTLKSTDPTRQPTAVDNTSYVLQALIARKLNEKTSVQLMPSFVHYNMAVNANDPNDRYSLGIGARQKISRRVSINAEYYYQFNKLDGYYNSLAVGVDIETGGHVFQLHFTNSTGMTETTFIHETDGRIGHGDIHFGFNLSRTFSLKKKSKIMN